jgi:hypothetical protein
MTYIQKHLNTLVLGMAVCISLTTVVVNPPTMQAQADFGSVQGIVTDTSGAAISGAKVTVHNEANGLTRQTQTNAVGEYKFTELPSGPYSLKVESPGFGMSTSNLAITVGGHLTLDAKLAVGSQATVVEVIASDANTEVNTSDAEVSEVISPLQLTELPTLTRNAYDFVALSGSVSADPNGSTGRGVGVSFSGTRAASTEILLDGVENVDLFSQSVASTIPLDSVSEYRIVTNGFSAQYGRASGGIVNLVTKGGTNRYHGSLYEYNRISALASNTYYEDSEAAFGTPLPADHFTQNQFGYSVGGPVLPKVKDKLFFFSNTEWNRVRSAGSQQFAVPTSAFLATTNSLTQAYFNQYGKIAPGVTLGSVIPQMDDSGNTLNAFQNATVTAPINAGAGNPINAWFTFDRVDFTPSDKTTMFFRYDSYTDDIFPGTNSLSPYVGFNTGSTDYDQAALANINHTFSPNLILNAKVTYTRTNGGQPLGSAGVVPGMYLDATNGASTLDNGAIVALPGYLPTSPGNAIPFNGPQNFYQVIGDLNWTKGLHTIQGGASFIQVRDNRTFGAYLNAIQTLSTNGSAADGLTALENGTIYSYNVAINPGGVYPCPINSTPTPSCSITLPVGPPDFTKENTFNDGNWYLSDTYKVTRRLTLDVGVRWEYYGVQHNTKPGQDTNFYLGSGSNEFEQIRSGSVMPAPSSPVHGLIAKSLNNYAPRVGFAYDVFGDGKTSIRGGYGISYERNFGNVTYNILFNPPYYGIIDLLSNTAGSSQLNIATNNYAPLQGSAGTTMALPPVELRALDPHIKTAYDYQYGLLIEREVKPHVLVSIGYTGTRGIHLYSIANINKAYSGNVYLGDPASGDTFGDPLNLQYGSINVRESNADSYYNGLNFKVEDNNISKYGLQLTANYTISHALDDLSTTFSESNNSFNLGYTNPFNPGLDRGNSDYDVRQRLVLEEIYQPTFLEFKSQHLLHTLLGGFEFPAIFTARTGTPFTVYDCTNALYACDRILPVPGLQYHGGPISPVAGSGNVFNYAVLPANSHNTYTDPIVGVDDFPTITSTGSFQVVGMGKDQFYDPNNWNLDLGAFKSFKITERYNLQFRSEFYNVLNHHNLYANAYDSYYYGSGDQEVYALKGTPNGYSQTSGDERRNVQLAMKFVF